MNLDKEGKMNKETETEAKRYLRHCIVYLVSHGDGLLDENVFDLPCDPDEAFIDVLFNALLSDRKFESLVNVRYDEETPRDVIIDNQRFLPSEIKEMREEYKEVKKILDKALDKGLLDMPLRKT